VTLTRSPESTRIDDSIERFTQTLVRFSPRDRFILALICRGASDKEIAAELEIHPKTARTHILRLTRKVGLADDRQLVLYVMQHPETLHLSGPHQYGLHAPGSDRCPYCQVVQKVA
jgi:DNA-binding CsgD family transcriptional regulator